MLLIIHLDARCLHSSHVLLRPVHQAGLLEYILGASLLVHHKIVSCVNEHLGVVEEEVREQFKLGAMTLHDLVWLTVLLAYLFAQNGGLVLDNLHDKVVMLTLHGGNASVVRHTAILLDAYFELQFEQVEVLRFEVAHVFLLME